MRIYLIFLGIMSLIAFILYAVDKNKAQNGEWRIPEATLLWFSFLGGAIGGYIAMQTVRHKTKHWYFHVVNILGILWQVALAIFLLVKFGF